jgi:hypothetical protein
LAVDDENERFDDFRNTASVKETTFSGKGPMKKRRQWCP